MGTNFYLHKPDKDVCPHCGRGTSDILHIGKSSAGWVFLLHVIPERDINDLPDWIREFEQGEIRDEYGGAVTVRMMLEHITDRAQSDVPWPDFKWPGYHNEAHFHAMNNSERGPNILLRHRVDGMYCVGHGKGTWDLIAGDFS